jgi:hypothetical protein
MRYQSPVWFWPWEIWSKSTDKLEVYNAFDLLFPLE